MKTRSKTIPVLLGIWGWVLATAWGLPAAPTVDAGAIQAIQQAPDPSAAVGAFANGFVAGRDDPNLYAAYVSRMVDLGLPELAFHQAQVLTTLEQTNGLAWGVVGYVNARRGDMPDATSAIVLAGRYAPDNEFVQRTAGEIVAWYDFKADKSQIPTNAQSGLAQIRARFGTNAAFTQAYATAKQAYTTQANPAQQSQAVPSQPENQAQAYSTVPGGYEQASPDYYDNNYYYDWGPGWVEPAPWWWWRPVGFFAGFDFVAFPTVFVFDRHHHRFVHDGDDRFFRHDQDNRVVWHRDASGRANFFGAPARPNVGLVPRTVATVPRVTTPMRSDPMAANRVAPTGRQITPGVTPPTMVRPTPPTTVRPAPPTMVRPMPPSAPPASGGHPSAGGHTSGGGGGHGRPH